MDSKQLKKTHPNLSKWLKFNEQILPKVPKKKGVYVIRLENKKNFGRLKGQSDVLYIGKTEAQNGLKQRISFYFRPGKTQLTNMRINSMQKKYKMEIAWLTSDDSNNLEHKLVNAYMEDHHELPPFNHAGCSRLKITLNEKLKTSDNTSVT